MFVRWQNRSRAEICGRQDPLLSAALVQTVRKDGKPRHQHLGYLGSIRHSEISSVRSRCLFWDRVGGRLDRLALSTVDRRLVEAALNDKVPHPTASECSAAG